jgi:hypothetical protein
LWEGRGGTPNYDHHLVVQRSKKSGERGKGMDVKEGSRMDVEGLGPSKIKNLSLMVRLCGPSKIKDTPHQPRSRQTDRQTDREESGGLESSS